MKRLDQKLVGAIDAWVGTLDRVPFHVFYLIEPTYIMSLMWTYGTLTARGVKKTANFSKNNKNISKTNFYCLEAAYDYSSNYDKIHAYNSIRMHPIALDEMWRTNRWPLRAFQFFLAITEVNIKLVSEYFFEREKLSQQEFCKKMQGN